MPFESIRIRAVLPISPDRLYAAWINGAEHSRFTGGKATSSPRVGGKHSAWNGYVRGTYLELEPGVRIVQTWRSEKFPADADDSHLAVILRKVPDGTEMTLVHTEIPEGQGAHYEKGWEEHYLAPMRKYFAKSPKKKAAPKKKANAAHKKKAKAAPKRKAKASPKKKAKAKK